MEELQNTAKDLSKMHCLIQSKLIKDAKKDNAYEKLFFHLKCMIHFANVIKKQFSCNITAQVQINNAAVAAAVAARTDSEDDNVGIPRSRINRDQHHTLINIDINVKS